MIARAVKSVLNRHKKRDDWFLDDYSINPYEGCSCNCLYCYIRGSKYKFLDRYYADLIPHYDELYNGQYYPPATYQAALKKRVDGLCKKYQLRSSILQHGPYSS